ncbi:MAG TPA: translocation/assembly module TamB domain-containing protein [Steroidobacteraceae bacterium]|nr:translocation/assembly module TamB domain-containing protein [Steroidobacteraceae bacterium]
MKRRVFKITAWTLGGLLAAVLLAVGGLLVVGNTDAGRAMIASWTGKLTGGHVRLAGLAGSFPSHLRLERLELSDGRGVWLSADRISLDWSPLAWLSGRLQIDAVHASDLDMERLPQSTSPPSTKPVSIPRIDAGRVSVDRVDLGAELAGRPASLSLQGSAHLRSVQDMSFDAHARRIGDTGDYVLKLGFDARRMDADLDLREPASGPLENILGVPGLGTLTATARLHGPRSAEVIELNLEAGALRGRAAGRFNLQDLSADVDFQLDSSALEPRPGIGWDGAHIQGRWHGSIKAPNADGHLDIERLRLPGSTALSSLIADVKAAAGLIAVHASAEGLEIPGPKPALLRDSPLTIDASMRLDQDTKPLQVSATHRLFKLQGSVLTAARPASATVALDLPALAAFSGLIGQDIRGSAQLKGEARFAEDATRLKVAVDAALDPGGEIWSAAVGRRAKLEAEGSMTPKAFSLDSAKLSGRAVSMAGSGTLSRAEAAAGSAAAAPVLSASFRLDLADLRTLSPALAGNLQAAGNLQGPVTAFGLTAKVTAALSVHGSPPGAVTASASARGLPSAPSGSVEADGTLDGAPLHLALLAERALPGTLHARIDGARWKSAAADGDITLTQAKGRSHGRLSLKVDDLQDFDRLLGTALAGRLEAHLLMRDDQGATHAELDASAHGLKAGAFLGDAELSASGVADSLTFKAAARAPDVNGSAADAAASGLFNYTGREIALTGASADYRGQTLRLLTPARISFADGVRIADLKLGVQHAVLEAAGAISPTMHLEASVHGVDAALVNAFAPGTLDGGAFEASARVEGDPSAPTGEIRVTAKDVRWSSDAAFGLPALDASATARLEGDHAAIDAGLDAGPSSHIKLAGTVPWAAGNPVDVKIGGSFDVGMFNALLEARGQHATGELAIDATVAGTVAEPQIGGTLTLSKGSIRDYSRGLGLTDINASLQGAEGTLEIKSLSAAAAPGTVSMTGSVGILAPGIPIDLKIHAANAQPIASKLVTSNLDADITVRGKLTQRIDIAGDVKLHRTLIGVPNSLPPNVAVLDVRRRGKTAVAPDKQLVVGLNLRIDSLQEILVQGRGLDAEVAGNLHLTGTTDTPSVSGGFELQRGTFSIGSSKLNFNPGGRVSFNGAGLKGKIDPTLDFTAQSTVGDVTATLTVSGLVDAPQFEFSSSPALPQDEIMARLLFGAPAAQLTGLQLAETGAALATLSGVGGDNGLNPLAKLQKSLGLDRLSIGAGTTNATGTENTGASIEAGRYISRRVFIAAKQTTSGASQLEANVDLSKHLKLQTRLGNGTSVAGTTPENDPGSSVGLSYQIEY